MAGRLRRQLTVLWRAAHDRRTPWYARAVAVATVTYALSPIDLIPDFIPVLGYLDDLVVVPLGLLLAMRLIPSEVLDDYRDGRQGEPIPRRQRWLGLAMVVMLWLGLAMLIAWPIARSWG